MSPEVPAFLVNWALLPGPRRVLDAARARLERGGLGARSVLAVDLSASERAEVGRLLPASWTPSGEFVRTRELRDGLAAHGTTLEQVLAATGGPVRDLRAESASARAAAADDRARALGVLREALAVGVPASAEAAVEEALARWVLRRAPAQPRAEAVLAVVRALPTEGGVALAVLAARLFGDAHALDRTRPLGRAVARFLAVRAAVVAAVGADVADPLSTPEAWRAAWASGGVTCDAVSSQVLVLNLRLSGDAAAVALCAAAPGEPVWLTLRSLTGGLALTAPADVFVCENPSVVEAAAARFGAASRPLICTFGRPSAAAWALLRAIAPSARLHVRADGDATGRSIVDALLAAHPDAAPWRMPDGSAQYEEELIEDLLADLSG